MYCSRGEVSLFIPQQENLGLELAVERTVKRVVHFIMVKFLCLHVNISFKNFAVWLPVPPCTFTVIVVMASVATLSVSKTSKGSPEPRRR